MAAAATFALGYVNQDAAVQDQGIAELDAAFKVNPFFNVFDYIPVAQAVPGGLEQAGAPVAGETMDLRGTRALGAADAAEHVAHERVRGRTCMAALLVEEADRRHAAGQGTGCHLLGARGAGEDQGLRRGRQRLQGVGGTPADKVLLAGTGAAGGGGSGADMCTPPGVDINSDKRIYQISSGLTSAGRAAGKHGPPGWPRRDGVGGMPG